MYEQQTLLDLQEIRSLSDQKSWLSGEDDHISQSQRSVSSHSNGSTDGNFDRVLYKDLVEMLPLVESLMGRRVNTSFTRRASLVYTKTPSKKISDLKGKKAAQSIPAKTRGDFGDNGLTCKKLSSEDYSIFSARTSAVEKDREPFLMLQEQVDDLQKKLLEKDEHLKSTENQLNQMNLLQTKLDELKSQAAEKDSMIKSVHLQLSDAKINLADKQAALEKLHWEASTSNRKIENLQEDLKSMDEEISAFMLLLERLATSDCIEQSLDYDVTPYGLDQPSHMDNMKEIEMQQMEEARELYIAALADAKESQDLELLEIAAKARLRLQSFVLEPRNDSS